MAFKMEPGRGNYAKTGKGVPMVLRQDPPVDPKSGKPKNTSGAFGGDTIMGDENNDGNMLTRTLARFGAGNTSSDDQALRAKNSQKRINSRFVSDVKNKGFIKAVKENFRF